MPSFTFAKQWQATLIKKVLFFLLFLSLFILVVIYVEPPRSWEEASIFQIMAFFLPLVFGLTAFVDILVHYIPHSFILSLGVILLLAFYGAGQLNYLTAILVVLITAFCFRIFPKMRLPRFRLTSGSKIPKLHMQKQEAPKKLKGSLRKLKHV